MRKVDILLHVRRLLCLFCTILFLGIACTADTVAAAEAEQTSDEVTTARKVKPEWKMPDFYPADGFDGMGSIDDIAVRDGMVVINDTEFKISSSAEYHTPTFKNAPGALFKVGDRVGYILDSENTIISMWLIVIKR